jgi:flagellar protein FliO/FliZ
MITLPRTLRLALLLALLGTPLFAADTPAKLDSESLIYPRNSPEARQRKTSDESFPLWGTLGVIAALTAGGLFLLKRGSLGARTGARVNQRLAIEETRPLGNKQFLAVATYGERRMLLAVCAGRIDLLCRLDEDGEAKPAPAPAPARREIAPE